MNETIRPGGSGDVQQLLSLYREYYTALPSQGKIYDLDSGALQRALETRVRSRLILTAVAEDESGALIGFVICSVRRLSPEFTCGGREQVGFLNDIYVAPHARGRGVARRLLDYGENWLREQGMKTMELQILEGNDSARQFWAHNHARPTATLCYKQL